MILDVQGAGSDAATRCVCPSCGRIVGLAKGGRVAGHYPDPDRKWPTCAGVKSKPVRYVRVELQADDGRDLNGGAA